MTTKPETIENRWDILYRDYPEVYDEFAAVPKTPDSYQFIFDEFDLYGKIIADIGAGTGISTFKLAKVASKVIGVESEESMLRVARQKAASLGLNNVEFIKGDAKNIPLSDSSVDAVTGFTLAIHPIEGFNDFVKEAQRVGKNNGKIILLGIAPGWYGGELDSIIEDVNEDRAYHNLMLKLGFQFKDFYAIQDYKSLDKIIRTYGFIFGKKAINYLKKHNKTKIKWKYRIHYKNISKTV